MKRSSRGQQAGISFIGPVFVMAVLACVGHPGRAGDPDPARVPGGGQGHRKGQGRPTRRRCASIFEKAAAIDDIKSISGKDLEIAKNGDKGVVSFAYNKEIHMFGPAFLLLKYAYHQVGARTA
jgi:hypothetical protein